MLDRGGGFTVTPINLFRKEKEVLPGFLPESEKSGRKSGRKINVGEINSK